METRIKMVAVVSLLLLAACHTTKKTASGAEKTTKNVEAAMNNKKLFQREWTLVAVSGISKDEFAEMQNKPTLNITETISGFAGCNRLVGGTYVLKGNEITISNLASTRKLCFGVGQKVEDVFLSVLNNAKTYKMEGVHLTLFTADNNRSAEFIALDKE